MEKEKFGKQAEYKMISILLKNGFLARKSTFKEDHDNKIDIWLEVSSQMDFSSKMWVALQVSLDIEKISKSKGRKSLLRGIVPMWIDKEKMMVNEKELAKSFMKDVIKILHSYNHIFYFKNPDWEKGGIYV